MSAQAYLQFLQNQVVFGSSSSFYVYINDEPARAVLGGAVTDIALTRAGKVSLRAEIDDATSTPISFLVKRGEIVSLRIVPSAGGKGMLWGLLTSSRNFLAVEILSRTNAR